MGTPTKAKEAELTADTTKKLVCGKFKDLALRFFGGLFMERKGDKWAISVGRVSWWMAFNPALYIWVSTLGKQDITDHHMSILVILAGYNMGKKLIEKLKTPPTNDGPG